ncbi:MAG: ATP-binding cassette domain-containing protein, partial [Rhodocyclaceae bacterium]|nr:ATP-binding cassette domain-containing protein [Rhodocyclaceae bacterium]
RASEVLTALGLGERLTHQPAQLSGGEQQRVAVARALANRPRLLLADEPTGNLDAATGRQVIDLMFEMNAEQGTTLILVTHDEALARRCGRTLRLTAGRLAQN